MNDSMINPSIINLLEKVDNRYSLVVATSRRARQLIEGAEPLVHGVGTKALTIAIQEVEEGIIKIDKSRDSTDDVEEEVAVNKEAEEGTN